jgi:hypothetical protein
MSFDKKQYYLDNKEKIKQYNLDNKEKFKEYQKQYSIDNKEKIIEKSKQWYLNNKEKFKEYQKQYHLDNKEKIIEKRKQYYLDNKEKFKEWSKKHRLNNKENRNKTEKERKNNDPLYKLTGNLRIRIYMAIKAKGWNKNSSNSKILGCDFETVKKHLENQFIDNMSWNNHGLFGWHIDHIIPLAKATTQEELYKLCHYTNLQPLWAADNLSKGSKEL